MYDLTFSKEYIYSNLAMLRTPLGVSRYMLSTSEIEKIRKLEKYVIHCVQPNEEHLVGDVFFIPESTETEIGSVILTTAHVSGFDITDEALSLILEHTRLSSDRRSLVDHVLKADLPENMPFQSYIASLIASHRHEIEANFVASHLFGASFLTQMILGSFRLFGPYYMPLSDRHVQNYLSHITSDQGNDGNNRGSDC